MIWKVDSETSITFPRLSFKNLAIQQRKFNMGHNLESNFYLSRIYKAVLKHEINVAIKKVLQFCDTAT